MWIVMAFILLMALVATRRMKNGSGPAAERRGWAYEFGRDFAVGIGGEGAGRYIRSLPRSSC